MFAKYFHCMKHVICNKGQDITGVGCVVLRRRTGDSRSVVVTSLVTSYVSLVITIQYTTTPRLVKSNKTIPLIYR